MEFIVKLTHILNMISGAAVILVGIAAYLFFDAVVPLLLAVGLVIVGPLEDLLKRYLKLPGVQPDQTKQFVDQITSLVLVLLLLAAVLLSFGTP